MSKSSAPSFLALSCVSALAFATGAHAQETAQGGKLGGMTVTDTAIDEPTIKVERAESPKYTAPLVDTPQTITVISRASIEQQNLLTLREVLSTVPGITFGAGEAGNGYGDRILLLGQDAKNDVTIDGVRSGAVVSRNETYNIEQVEITTGANSAQSGGGSVAGTINLVTKRPLPDNRTVVSAGIGTDNYYRATVDANRRINDLIAVRLNAVYHENEVPGRDLEYYDRWGVSPSLTIGIDSPTNLTIQYDHLTDHSVPQYGARYFPRYGGFLEGQNLHSYYGTANLDKQNSDTDSIQTIFSHEFSDTLRIRNLTRYEDIQQDTITSNIGGSFCAANGTAGGFNPATAAADTSCGFITGSTTVRVPVGYYQPTGSRGVQRFIRNETAYNQFDVIGTLNTGGVEHSFTLGASALWQKYRQDQGNILRNADGTIPVLPIVNFDNPNDVVPLAGYTVGSNIYTGPVNFIHGSQANGRQNAYSAYFFDTVKFTDWLQINGGVRYDHISGRNFSYSYNITNTAAAPLGQVTAATALAADTPSRIKNNLFSYRVGLVVKPTEDTTLYVAHGNSKLPSQSSISESCTRSVPANPTATPPVAAVIGNCTTTPQITKNYEIGAKAELFAKRMLVSAALFRNDRNYNVTPAATAGLPDQVSDGKQRSQGVSFGASGNITDEWTLSANYMYLDAYTIQSVIDGTADPIAGSPNINAPEHSGSIFTTYRLPFGLQVGYGLSYQGSFFMNQYSSANPTAPIYKVPSYVTQRLMLSYPITDRFSAQVNVQNLFDEKYVTTVRTSVGESWAVPGPERSAVLSLTATF
ncbi:MAG: TonB-dependent receptor [Sphingobium sp.]